jgi:hypothetical protein
MNRISRQAPPALSNSGLNGSRSSGLRRPSLFSLAGYFSYLTALCFLALVNGCTKESGGVIDPSGVPPFVGSAVAFPDTIKMSSLPQSNGVLSVSLRAQAKIILASGSAGIATVNVDVVASGATVPFMTVSLHDDGASPDSLAGDGLYSGLIQFTIPRSTSGVYLLRTVATDKQGFVSNAVETPLVMLRNSHAPVLSNLLAPDSVFVPTGGVATIQLSIKATDQDGQADIKAVYFLSLDSSNPTQQFGMTAAPGDSIYSLIVQAPDGPNVRKRYRFSFQAVNNFGDTSASLIHSITLY